MQVSWDSLLTLLSGATHLTWANVLMIAIGGVLIYLAIAKEYEPVLLIPIGVGAILANIPGAGMGIDVRAVAVGRADGRGVPPALQGRHRDGALPAAPVHRHRRDDRLRAAAVEPENGARGRGRAVRHLCRAAAGARLRHVHAEPGRLHRHHRRDRRPHQHLRLLPVGARAAGADHRLRLHLHEPGAHPHAAAHAPAHHQEGARRADALRRAAGEQADAHPLSASSSPSSSALSRRRPAR